MADRFSVDWWMARAEARLADSPSLVDAVGADWVRRQYRRLEVATHQPRLNLLMRLVLAEDEDYLAAVELFDRLNAIAGTDARIERVRIARSPAQQDALWNELRSAALFVQCADSVSFVDDRRGEGRQPEFESRFGELVVGVEVATVCETDTREKSARLQRERYSVAARRARKRGDRSVFGGAIELPSRFRGVTGAVDYIKRIKKGAPQLEAYRHRVLHVVSSTTFFRRSDFVPVSYWMVDALLHAYTGRIFAAFYGGRGQRVYWHHFVGHGDDYFTAEQLPAPGRFVEETTLSGAVFTLHDHDAGGHGQVSGLHVLYSPLRGAGDALPGDILEALSDGLPVEPDLSVLPGIPSRKAPAAEIECES